MTDAMTLQEIFNKVAIHLITQNEQSLDTSEVFSFCAYRSPNGLKCAVGCLIKDEFYHPKIEGCSVYSREILEVLEKSGISVQETEVVDLLEELQGIHDYNILAFWKIRLKEVAEKYNLEIPDILKD